MVHRIVQWSTGNVGRAALRGIIAHPELELVGVWVSSGAKEGLDAGRLAGLDREVGVAATTDAQALVDTAPDVVCYTAMADDRLGDAIEDLCRLLRAGIDVVSSSPVFLQFPAGAAETMAQPVREAARAGGASLFVNGVDPGFANDALPLTITGVCERIEESHERLPAPEDIEVDSGTIPKGTAAALRFELAGVVDGTRRLFLEHVTRTHDDLAPDWPQPAGAGCYRVVVSGSPSYTVDLQLLGEDGDHNTAGLQATAMRLVNAVPHVVAADPGIVTALDLPMVTGRGLLA
jgi:2,4-diaminopentanoate dehydrogenase